MQASLEKIFHRVFGDSREVRLYKAPGRVNLIGEHTDYNGGYVLPCPISYGIWGAARKRQDSLVRLYSENFPSQGVLEFTLEELVPVSHHGWANYPKGMLWALREWGYPLSHGMEVAFWGNLPSGAGLSSSAAMEVLMGSIAEDLFALSLEGEEPRLTMARIAQKGENDFMQVQSGIMDQCAIALGRENHALFLHCETLKYCHIPLLLEDHLLLILDTQKPRELVVSAYNERHSECTQALVELNRGGASWKSLGEISPEALGENLWLLQPKEWRKRARHVVSENQRTKDGVAALEAGDLKTFGDLMNKSHLSLQLDFEVSCAELDCLVECAWQHPGCLGARMTGAGFGGCAVALVQKDQAQDFAETLSRQYLHFMERKCALYPVSIPSGARRL